MTWVAGYLLCLLAANLAFKVAWNWDRNRSRVRETTPTLAARAQVRFDSLRHNPVAHFESSCVGSLLESSFASQGSAALFRKIDVVWRLFSAHRSALAR